MNVVSGTFDEKTRKTVSIILSGLSRTGQTHVAEALNVSDATITRMKEAQIDQFAKLLTACSLKVVQADEVVIDPGQLAAVESLFKTAVAKTGLTDLLRKAAN